MATYYNGNSEIQGGDGLQTLVLMNRGYLYYSDTQQSTQSQSENFNFLDSNHPVNNNNNPVITKQMSVTDVQFNQHTNMVAPQPPPQLVGVPLSASPPSSVRSYMYSPVEMVAAPPREVTPFQQGLSLSLSSQQSRYASQTAGVPFSPTGDDRRPAFGGGGGGGGDDGGMHNMLLNSKYLKATQEILEEVVSVGKVAVKIPDQSTKNLKITGGGDGGSPVTGEGETTIKSGNTAQLTTSERQEIQMKKSKLVNMLDEVDQRYKQYHNQMKVVISWFEQSAGLGSAKTYTSLALQTISKQFRSLKDTIMGQIKVASLSLGEDDDSGGGSKADGGGSRLKYVDNQLRQQRALQQLGMIQHNAWRPQRGLPERAVSVLRAWLFEHFLHPYPKDSDKHMLAKQTGLTKSQVSNWFINARVRLWKPMVEEMYLEEIKDHEPNQTEPDKSNKNNENEANSSTKRDKTLSPENSNLGFQVTKQENNFHLPPSMVASTTVSTPPTATGITFQNPSVFSLIRSVETNRFTSFSPKKPRNEMHQQTQDTNFTVTGGNPTDIIGVLGGYPIGEIGRFTTDQFQQHYSGNGVSLTLGLPHCENLSISNNHQSFHHNQNTHQETDYTTMDPQSSSHTAALYESMNIQNRKRFAAQPLPDFVA